MKGLRLGRSGRGLALTLLLVIGQLHACLAQLSAPISQDDHVAFENNKFMKNDADLDKDGAL